MKRLLISGAVMLLSCVTAVEVQASSRGSPSAEHRSIGNGSVEPGSQSAGEGAASTTTGGKPGIGKPGAAKPGGAKPGGAKPGGAEAWRREARPSHVLQEGQLEVHEQGLCPELHETSLVPQPHVVLGSAYAVLVCLV